MSLDAFNREAGTRQGRIVPVGVPALDRSSVFCLGYDGTLHADQVAAWDYTQVSQTAIFQPSTKLFRARAWVRPPVTAPFGAQWVVGLMIDAVVVISAALPPGTRTRLRSFTANVSKVTPGPHTVTLFLQLQATS